MTTGPIVPDTSAWVEFLRGTGSAVDRRFDDLLRDPRSVVVTDPVLAEVLAGARDRAEWIDLKRLLGGCEFARVEGPMDWEDAAVLYRRLRLSGRTVKSLVDCLVAVVAMRIGAPVLHADADFDAIAEHSSLQIA